MIGGLLPLLVLGGIVYAIVKAVQGRGQDSPDAGSGVSARRLFQYALLYAALLVAGSGLSGLLGQVLSNAAVRRSTDIAFPMAMAVVGVPVFIVLARWARRTLDADPTERATAGWSLYLNGALVTALAIAVGAAFGTAEALIDASWNGEAFAALAVWSAAWAMHWWVWRLIEPGFMPNLHLWVGSTMGLWIGGVSAVIVADGIVKRVFEAISTTVAVSIGRDDTLLALAGLAIGVVVWAWYWLLHGVGTTRSQGWYVYVLLAGVLTGSITVVVSAGLALYEILEWFFGDHSAISAAEHFLQLSSAVGAFVVGAAVWTYHRSVLGPRSVDSRNEVDRVYDYLVAGVALATTAVALAILVVAGFEAFASDALVDAGGSSTNTLLVAVTLLVVGAPLWGVTWLRIQRFAADSEAEVASGTRRTYIFGVLGIGGAIAFGALIWLLVLVFEALFEGGDPAALPQEMRWPVALLATTGLAAGYHWVVYRSERTVTPPVPYRDVLLIGDGAAIAAEVGERAHAHVRLLQRTDLDPGATPDVDTIVAAIQSANGDHLVVIVGNDGVECVPTTETIPREVF